MIWLLLFIGVPAAELWILFSIGTEWGILRTVALIVTTGIIGASLVRLEGLKVISTLRQDLSQGQLPKLSIVEGVLLLVAGAFLITPGVLTDAAGFLLAIPPSRRWFAKLVAARITVHRAPR